MLKEYIPVPKFASILLPAIRVLAILAITSEVIDARAMVSKL